MHMIVMIMIAIGAMDVIVVMMIMTVIASRTMNMSDPE